MLDKRTQQMLQVASLLAAEELDEIRGNVAGNTVVVEEPGTDPEIQEDSDVDSVAVADVDSSRGARERQRTRESKVSTACIGQPRQPHPWWPMGTELIGRIGTEEFTATVIENTQVKSGRSLLLTSGAAKGKLCITPTRAAMEATEAYRQANNLGRGGGVTNGWSFWSPKN